MRACVPFGHGLMDKLRDPFIAAAVRDLRGRITSRDVVDGDVEIRIGLGANQGVAAQMPGVLVDANGHRSPAGRFVVREVSADTCVARVHTTSDDVRAHGYVVLNPSAP